jgi:hypothetical protein
MSKNLGGIQYDRVQRMNLGMNAEVEIGIEFYDVIFIRQSCRLYLLTPWSRVLLEKLTSLRSYPRNSPHFMEPEGSLPYSQVSCRL